MPGDGTTALDVGAHTGGKFVEFRAVGGGEVGGFEGIFFEVEEFPGLHGGIFDELPGPSAHGPAGLAHVAEISFAADPEEVALEGGLAA